MRRSSGDGSNDLPGLVVALAVAMTAATAIPAQAVRDLSSRSPPRPVVGVVTPRDNLGGTHTLSFDVTYTAVGPLRTTVNGPGSKRSEREATATGQVVFDGVTIVDGANNHPTRPALFIRVDTEK
jgi:hypothetical protein